MKAGVRKGMLMSETPKICGTQCCAAREKKTVGSKTVEIFVKTVASNPAEDGPR